MSEFLSNFTNTLENPPNVIRQVVAVNTCLGNHQIGLLDKFGRQVDPMTADCIASKFASNSEVASHSLLGGGKPLSAFYTYFREGFIVIEQGGICPNREAKLHDYLRESINYVERVQNGAIVRSGHTGSILFPMQQTPIRLALFDNLQKNISVSVSSVDFPIIATLLNNDIIPVTSDGYPVKVH